MTVPQPSLDRLVPPPGHPLVVGVLPGQSALVLGTAAAWARALGGVPLHLAYADPSRVVVREFPDGTVLHSDLDPDRADDSWRQRQDDLEAFAARVLSAEQEWRFSYLAGRADRALTHLARAVDAGAIVVGAQPPGAPGALGEALAGSVGARLARHQHRPVLVVPQTVVDWKAQGW